MSAFPAYRCFHFHRAAEKSGEAIKALRRTASGMKAATVEAATVETATVETAAARGGNSVYPPLPRVHCPPLLLGGTIQTLAIAHKPPSCCLRKVKSAPELVSGSSTGVRQA